MPNYGLKVISDGGTVIIDGNSNMFKIAATGTRTLTGCNGSAAFCQASTNVDLLTELTVKPAHLMFVEDSLAYSLENLTFFSDGTFVDQKYGVTSVVNTNQTRVTIVWNTRTDRSAVTNTFRYFVLKETAF